MATDTTAGPRALLTADAVAQRLAVSRWRVYEMAREGTLPSVRLGRALRFDPAALESWIQDGGTGYDPDNSEAA